MGEATGSSVPDPALAARFTRLVESSQAALHSFALGMVGERELARDIVQEAFVAAWRVASQQRAPWGDPCDDEGARRWLFAVTYRQAARVLRRRRHFVWQSLDQDTLQDVAALSPDVANGVVEADALRSALSALAPVDAACFLLQAVQGLTTREIAAIVHLRPDVVRKRLSRSRQRLRAAYAVEGSRLPNS
jgi:RNA polymerase sigma-70 factor (ECF subfamily)